ncbi:MAG TPA: hypothetical protein VGW10_05790, partial [Solirubrobacteraceae bacterium]|nr:hypothetical protein [Solirubrobacteraceae bacterium]
PGGGGTPPVGMTPGAPPPRRSLPVRLRVRPASAIVGRRTRFRVIVEVFRDRGWQRAPRARVRFAGRTVRVGRAGVLRFTRRFSRPGPYRLRATFRGVRSPAVILRVRRR